MVFVQSGYFKRHRLPSQSTDSVLLGPNEIHSDDDILSITQTRIAALLTSQNIDEKLFIVWQLNVTVQDYSRSAKFSIITEALSSKRFMGRLKKNQLVYLKYFD